MSAFRRRPFFIKGNFQISFIAGFALMLFAGVFSVSFVIYRLSAGALGDAAFSSHINIENTSALIKPIIIKANICAISVSIILASAAALLIYLWLHSLFRDISAGLEQLSRTGSAARIRPRGIRRGRELIREFNEAASYLEKRRANIRLAIDGLLAEKKPERLAQLHKRLHSIIAGQ